MASPLTLGDFVNIANLLYSAYTKCKGASAKYKDLAQLLLSTQLCVESARLSVTSIFDSLPSVHKQSLSTALVGLRDVATQIQDSLAGYKKIVPGGGPQLSKLKFGLFEDPREAEARLTPRLSLLNTCMAAIIKYVE